MSTTKENRPPEQEVGQGKSRPMSAIIPSIMGENLGPAKGDNARSASATSGGSRQHKLKQRFTVIRKLGKGTYGKVQLAINKETGQEVAIKTIKKTKIDSEQDLERVRREIQIMSSIEHPHIIHIYEVFENKDKIVLIMQYAPGGELYEYVSQSKGLDEQEARRLFRQIATAIFYCHQNKICHRDLKLENILLDEKNNAKLADFGLSNVFDQSYQLKTFCGSPLYASPEIVQGSPYEGPEVDCWSLGVLLYTLVYGAMPFDGSNFKRLVRQISEASYHEPKQRSQASPLIAKLLCADPIRRASIRDICLDPWVNGRSISNSSPRVSPTPLTAASNNGSTQHPPLLNVAQDMANLTPVRLDILLTLTRKSVDSPQPQRASEVPKTEVDSRVQRDKTRLELEDKSKDKEVAMQQELDMRDRLEGELMNVDETQPTSHVANYIVRDLEPPERPSAMDEQNELAAREEEEEEGKLEIAHSGAHHMEVEPAQSNEPDKMELDQSEVGLGVGVQVEAGPEAGPAPEQFDEPVISRTDAGMELDAHAIVEPVTESNSEPPELKRDTKVQEARAEEQKGEVSVSVTKPEVSEEAPEVAQTAQVVDESNKVEPAVEGVSPSVASESEPAAAPEGAGEGKSKRVKKRIVVVKKKKKVPKKETDDKDQSVEPEDEAARDSQTANSDKTPDGRGSAAPSVGSGPGKVRIPETFQPAAGDSANESSEQQTKPVITRRQSALIADVSQKLLQLQQQDTSQSIGSSAIEQDQHQLASVRVSDTKSEFERRASLAALASIPLAPTSPKRNELSPTPAAQEVHQKEEPVEIKQEQLDLMLISGEPVIKVEPLEVEQPKVVCPAGPILSEPQTPTNAQQQRHPLASKETLTRCADRLSVELQVASREGERSDSVETIKADTLEGARGETEVRRRDGSSDSADRSNKVRSSLQIDLKASPNFDDCDESRFSQATPASSFEPAPITRSYKRVTFMKDGARVTETGRIYSTRDHDGTLRHVERKSKVTHYPSGLDHSTSGTRMSEATTHEEVLYELDRPQHHQWRESRSRRRDQPLAHRLERLVMPAEEAEDESFGERSDPNSDEQDEEKFCGRERAGSWSSCSSGSTDVFDDIFDTWTGAISMFNQGRSGFRTNLMRHHRPFGNFKSSLTRLNQRDRPQSSGIGGENLFFQESMQRPSRERQQQPYRDEADARPFQHSAFGTKPRRHRSRQNSARAWPQSGQIGGGRMSAEPSGREFSSPFDRPASANLGSARGRFGSTNLFPRPDESLAFGDEASDHLLDSDWQANSLLERMELEHERIRKQFAQRRNQMWKGSTPSLNEIRLEPLQIPKPQQPQQSKRTSVVFETSSGGSLRQSTPLDSAPIRRNTAQLGEHTPQQATLQRTQRSSSKTSIITSKLANIQLSQPDTSRVQQQHKTSKFIELKRNHSAAASAPIASGSPHSLQSSPFDQLSIRRSHLQQNESGTNSSFQDGRWNSKQTTPSATCFNSNLSQPSSQTYTNRAPADSETNSRIQNWLLQSSDNLSISSGSKSSTSDATLPSSSGGRSDLMAAAFLGSSAGQMPIDRALSMGPQLSQTVTTRTHIGSELPPTPSRSPGRSVSSLARERSPRPSEQPVVSMVVRSSSRQSMRQLEQPGHAEQLKVHETTETILTDHSTNRISTVVEHSAAASCSSVDFTESSVRPQRSEFVETRSMVTSSRQVFNQSAMSPQLLEHRTHGPAFQGANFERASLTQPPPPPPPPRMTEDFNDFDSMLGSGAELNSRSSSSLLEQLRSRGYRSMMNQRIMTPGVARQQPALNSQTDPTTTQPTGSNATEQDVVASSSNSLSSSGIFAGQSRPLDDQPRDFANEPNQTESNTLQAGSHWSSPQILPSTKEEVLETIGQKEASRNGAVLQPADQVDGTGAGEAKAQQPSESQPNEDADLDEDVREAKANIKKYLDRVKETEQFIKSIQEEEERFQRQQQESFLFNNLLLHTKFSAFSLNGRQRNGLDWSKPSSVNADPVRVPQTAPIVTANMTYGTASRWERPAYGVNSIRIHQGERPSRLRSRALSLEPTVSCFSAELYKPLPECRSSFAQSSAYETPDLIQTRSARHRYASPAPSNRCRRISQVDCGQLSSDNESDSLDDDPEMSAYRPSRYVPETVATSTFSKPARVNDRSKSVTRFDKLNECDIVAPGTSSRLSELEQRIQANKRRREELLQRINSEGCEATS